MKMTNQRSMMLEYLRETKDHPTAHSVYLEIKRHLPHISQGTVYRNLNIFRDAGLISEFNLSGTNRFDGNVRLHYHLYCRACGKVEDFESPGMDEIIGRVEDEYGVHVTSFRGQFEGVCSDCSLIKEEKKWERRKI